MSLIYSDISWEYINIITTTSYKLFQPRLFFVKNFIHIYQKSNNKYIVVTILASALTHIKYL